MQPLRILIVDDEAPARKKLRAFLREEEGVGSVEEAESGVEALEAIEAHRPDLVFLDIQMPRMNGFEVIEAVGARQMPPVVFVTAFEQYALDAFEVQALDYLLKPYDAGRFRKSFSRAREHITLRKDHQAQYESLLRELRKGEKYIQRIMVKLGQRFFFVNNSEILYIGAAGKYVDLHTTSKIYPVRESLLAMEERLDPALFVRIHRSTLLNINYIQEINPWFHGDCTVVLKSGERLTLSRRYRDRLFRDRA